jgi:hypothetical protein
MHKFQNQQNHCNTDARDVMGVLSSVHLKKADGDHCDRVLIV